MGKKFKGVVTEVANSANISGLTVDQVTNFTVKVRVLRESYEQMADPGILNGVFFIGHVGHGRYHDQAGFRCHIRTDQSVTTRDTTERRRHDRYERRNNKMEDGPRSPSKDEKAEKAEKADQLDESDKRVECVFLLDNGKVRLVPENRHSG